MYNKARSVCVMFSLFSASSFAAPADYSIKEAPVLFEAIAKEDKTRYSQEMQNLLHGPMKNFMEVILFKTESGDTIFHIMAGVRSHQPFFAEEIQSLINFSSRTATAELSLGGFSLSIPKLRNTNLGQAIKSGNTGAILSIAESLNKTPAIEVIQTLLAISDFESLKSLAFKHLSTDQLLYLRDRDIEKKIQSAKHAHAQISSLLLMKNNKGLSPKNIAVRSANLPVQIVISDTVNNLEESTLKKGLITAGGITAGLAAWFFLGDFYFEEALSQVSQASSLNNAQKKQLIFLLFGAQTVSSFGAGTLGGLATSKCYDLFQKMKTNKLRKQQKKINLKPK